MYIPTATLTQGSRGGEQLDYAQTTSDTGITASTEGTAITIVSGAALNFDGNTTIVVEFWASVYAANSVGTNLTMYLFQDGSSIGIIGEFRNNVATNGVNTPVFCTAYLTPTAGSHTYSIRGASSVAGGNNLTVYAGAGGSGNRRPAFMRIYRASS